MIIPRTREQQWLDELAHLPHFDPGEAPMLVLSPHPDDETLGAGGLIASQCARSVAVEIVAVTDGEGAYPNEPSLAATRIAEQRDAANVLSNGGARLTRLFLPDRSVADHIASLQAALLDRVDAGTHLIAPFLGDYHPDHFACGLAAREVARITGCRLTEYFFWTWHRGTPRDLHGLHLSTFPLTLSQSEIKLAALACHRSQLEHHTGNPILPERLLAPAKRPFEVFLEHPLHVE